MAGDAGSPQNQPTDLSMKPRRGESDELKDYGSTTEGRKSHFKFKSDMAAYYATFDKPYDLTNKSSVIKSTAQVNQEGAIRNAITAITRSLTPTSATAVSRDQRTGRTPSDEEVFVYNNNTNALKGKEPARTPGPSSKSPDVEITRAYFKPRAREALTPTAPLEPKRRTLLNDKTYLYFKNAREHPVVTTPGETESASFLDDKLNWRFPTADRPQYLDLRHVSDMSPDSGLGSATPIFGATPRSISGSTTSPETPSGTSKYGKKRKRKYGPGRGWKFHDLSNDGGSNRKRVYAQNKLENGILQRFQEHVCVKSVATADGSKDKLIVVEPSEVNDSDLIRCGTALRVVFDKDAGTYKLQLLPYTLEEGPLSDQEKVLLAVSKMLGFNNEVLCPNAFKALMRTGSRVIIGDSVDEPRSFTPPANLESLAERAAAATSSADMTSKKVVLPHEIGQAFNKSSAHKRDALLWSLNNELKRYNTAMADAAAAGRKTCLMWHTPQFGLLPGKKKYVPVTKYCANCRSVPGVPPTQPGT